MNDIYMKGPGDFEPPEPDAKELFDDDFEHHWSKTREQLAHALLTKGDTECSRAFDKKLLAGLEDHIWDAWYQDQIDHGGMNTPEVMTLFLRLERGETSTQLHKQYHEWAFQEAENFLDDCYEDIRDELFRETH